MKSVMLMLCCLTLWVFMAAGENNDNQNRQQHTQYMARVLRARLAPMGAYCGKFKDPCGVLLPCCEADGYDCDYSGGYSIGKCEANKK